MEKVLLGRVYRAHSDLYYVKSGNKEYKCVARGVLKLKRDGIIVGDVVNIQDDVITEVLPRKNRFIRPNVSNVDAVVISVAPEPKPDFFLIDKLVLNAIKENVKIIFVANKTDVCDKLIDEIKREYINIDATFIDVSAKNGNGVNELKNILIDKVSVFAGQSAVGKTSMVNAMFGFELKTGELSKKILRGRHTTTHSEIFEKDGIMVIDAPGFAVIDAQVELDELPDCYPEYFSVSNECKFRGCKHISEPDCAVKIRVENGVLSKNRYERYVQIYNEISKRRKIYEKN